MVRYALKNCVKNGYRPLKFDTLKLKNKIPYDILKNDSIIWQSAISIIPESIFFIHILVGIAGALFYGAISTFILGNSHTVLIGASGAISGILGIAAAAGNTRAYYWLLIQIVFSIVCSFTAIQIAFTAHIGGFIAGVLLTKVLIVATYVLSICQLH